MSEAMGTERVTASAVRMFWNLPLSVSNVLCACSSSLAIQMISSRSTCACSSIYDRATSRELSTIARVRSDIGGLDP
jgi:hypothetical protein